MRRRRTQNLLRLAVALMDDPMGRHWGYGLAQKAHIPSASAYPTLDRMLEDGWLTDGWEDQPDGRPGRPLRRYYELTDLGRRELGALAAEAHQDVRLGDLGGLLHRLTRGLPTATGLAR